MTLVAILSLIALTWRLVGAYRADSLIHPGLWYSAAWISAIICYLAIDAVGGVPIPDDYLLDNLMSFVIFGAAGFFFMSLLPFRRKVRHRLEPSKSPAPPFRMFSVVGLAGAIINWVVLGAPLGYDDSLRQQWLEQIPRVTALTWYLYLLAFPAAIVAGRTGTLWLLYGMKPPMSQRLWLLVPIAAGFFWTLGTGGRQAFGFVLLYYVAGAFMAVAIGARQGRTIPLKRAMKIASITMLCVVGLAVFIGLTGQARAKQQGAQQASDFDQYWYLAPIGQFLTYNGMAIATHQVYGEPQLRDISETGPVSIAGLQSFGLRYITGWRLPEVEDTNPERALASTGLPLAYGTRNLFYDLQADFGYAGAFIAAGIMLFVSHIIFLLSGGISKGRLLPASALVMALLFWGYSHQFSLLMFNTFSWLLLSCIAWDVAARVRIRFRRPNPVV